MSDWWNTSYYFRRNIVVDPNPLRPLEAGYPIYVQLDHALYISSNKLRSDFEDIVIVYQPLEGATPVEMPTPADWIVPHKVIYDVDDQYLQVVFNAVDPIVDENYDYYIYFNNPTLTNVIEPDAFVDSDFVIEATPAVYNSNLTFSRPNEDWIDGVSTVINARAALSFYGVNARLKLVKGPDKGIVEVRIDKEDPFYIDTFAQAESTVTAYTTSDLDVAPHYMRLRVTGEKAPSSDGHGVEIAAFEYSNYEVGTLLDEEIYAPLGALQTIVGP